MNPTNQPTIFNINQVTIPRHSDWKHFLIRSFNSGIYVPIYGQNIDNRTGMNPHGPIMTTIQESNRANDCNISDLVNRPLSISYRVLALYATILSEIENCRGKKENAERENSFEVEKVARENSVIWNLKYSDSIQVDNNHTDPNQPFPDDFTVI